MHNEIFINSLFSVIDGNISLNDFAVIVKIINDMIQLQPAASVYYDNLYHLFLHIILDSMEVLLDAL